MHRKALQPQLPAGAQRLRRDAAAPVEPRRGGRRRAGGRARPPPGWPTAACSAAPWRARPGPARRRAARDLDHARRQRRVGQACPAAVELEVAQRQLPRRRGRGVRRGAAVAGDAVSHQPAAGVEPPSASRARSMKGLCRLSVPMAMRRCSRSACRSLSSSRASCASAAPAALAPGRRIGQAEVVDAQRAQRDGQARCIAARPVERGRGVQLARWPAAAGTGAGRARPAPASMSVSCTPILACRSVSVPSACSAPVRLALRLQLRVEEQVGIGSTGQRSCFSCSWMPSSCISAAGCSAASLQCTRASFSSSSASCTCHAGRGGRMQRAHWPPAASAPGARPGRRRPGVAVPGVPAASRRRCSTAPSSCTASSSTRRCSGRTSASCTRRRCQASSGASPGGLSAEVAQLDPALQLDTRLAALRLLEAQRQVGAQPAADRLHRQRRRQVGPHRTQVERVEADLELGRAAVRRRASTGLGCRRPLPLSSKARRGSTLTCRSSGRLDRKGRSSRSLRSTWLRLTGRSSKLTSPPARRRLNSAKRAGSDGGSPRLRRKALQQVVDVVAAIGQARQAQPRRIDLQAVDHRRQAQQRARIDVDEQPLDLQLRRRRRRAGRGTDGQVAQRQRQRRSARTAPRRPATRAPAIANRGSRSCHFSSGGTASQATPHSSTTASATHNNSRSARDFSTSLPSPRVPAGLRRNLGGVLHNRSSQAGWPGPQRDWTMC